MSQAVAVAGNVASLSGLLLPLTDRTLLLPNVALAELVAYRSTNHAPGMPAWLLGEFPWRDLRLPLLCFEAASNGTVHIGPDCCVAVLNAMGGRPQVKFFAMLLQDIPQSVKVDARLAFADAALAPLELGTALLNGEVVKIPDLIGLEQLMADVGLI